MKKPYIVFILQGFENFDEATGQLKDVATFEIIAKNYKEALKKAKSIFPKKNYRLSSVIERY